MSTITKPRTRKIYWTHIDSNVFFRNVVPAVQSPENRLDNLIEAIAASVRQSGVNTQCDVADVKKRETTALREYDNRREEFAAQFAVDENLADGVRALKDDWVDLGAEELATACFPPVSTKSKDKKLTSAAFEGMTLNDND